MGWFLNIRGGGKNMNFVDILLDCNKWDSPKKLIENEVYLRQAGFIGYLFGIFTLFLSLKLLGVIPGVFFSFLFFSMIIVILNYIFAAITNLFMNITGHKENSSSLFYFFGIANLGWIFLLPLVFISEIISINFSFFFSLIAILVFLFKLKAIKTIYNVRYKLAIISFFIPYILFMFILVGGSGYLIYWALEILA